MDLLEKTSFPSVYIDNIKTSFFLQHHVCPHMVLSVNDWYHLGEAFFLLIPTVKHQLSSLSQWNFTNACQYGCFRVARLIDRENPSMVPSTYVQGFRIACENGHLAIAQWLVTRFGLTVEDIRSGQNDALLVSCVNGHLEVAQWLVTRFSFTVEDIRSGQNEALRVSCANGHLEVAQWLVTRFGLTVEDIRSGQNEALRWS